jgi:hypothetical protein
MTLMRDTSAACSGARRRHHVAQHAIDAIADHRAVFIGFQMNVGGALAQALRQQRVDQPDDRRVVFRFEQIADGRNVLRQRGEVNLLFQVVHDLRGMGFLARIGLRQTGIEIFRAQQTGNSGAARIRRASDKAATLAPSRTQTSIESPTWRAATTPCARAAW